RVEGNPVFIYHDAFNPNIDEVNDLKERYRSGTVGDVEVKTLLTEAINRFLEPSRERRQEYENKPSLIKEALEAGSTHAKKIAQETMGDVREALEINYFKE
ncbi:uncharacterized protein METZ01_LOCUS357331, partial [marine metagenome]